MTMEALIARVEGASGPDDDLFREAFDLCFPKPTRVWEDEDHEEWTPEYSNYHNRSWAFEAFLEARAYLDAAVSLVPEGWCYTQGSRAQWKAGDPAWAWCEPDSIDWDEGWNSYAATPALALCAAALRARTAKDTDDGE